MYPKISRCDSYVFSIQGFRTQQVVLVTTLLDPQIYTHSELAELYCKRWRVEVNLRHLKTTLNMEMLRGKSPEMVRKEVYVHLMAYNLLCAIILKAAISNNLLPQKISLQATRQHFRSLITILGDASEADHRQLVQTLLKVLVQKLLPLRSERSQPRVVKRRPKSYPPMTRPRT